MSHKCHAYKCNKEIPPKLFMCMTHWRMLPQKFKNDIWKYYRPGQEIDKSPSSEYLKAAQRATALILLIQELGDVSIEDRIKALEKMRSNKTNLGGFSMKVNEVKYVRRVPREEYGYEEVAIAATPEKNEDAEEILTALKASVAKALEAPATEEEETEEEETPPPKRGKKKPVDEEEESEESEEETEEESEEGEQDGNEEEESEENEDEDKGKKGKKVRSKAAAYDRGDELHKKLFAEQLKKIDSKWNESAKGKAKAKKISEQLDGDEFIDKNGDLVGAFLIAMRKAYKGK